MKKHMEIMEWLHATLIFSLLIPLVCAVGAFPVPEGTVIFYLKCLFVAVPVAVTGIALKRTKTLWGYILACIMLLAAVGGVTAGIPYLMGQRGFPGYSAVCYRIGILVETAIIAIIRLMDRIKRIRYIEERKSNPFVLLAPGFLNQPLSNTGYFIVMYIMGILFESKLLCDLALFCAVIYWFIALAYKFFGATEHYFMLNKRTKGIPKRRLYAISGGMLCLFAGIMLVAVLPSFLLINARKYTNVREWFGDVPLIPYSYEGNGEFRAPAGGDMDGTALLLADSAWNTPEPLEIWDDLFWILEIIVGIVVLGVTWAMIRKIFQDFRKEADENGDKIENLEDAVENERIAVAVHKPDGETSDIKRRYKRTIRRYRKERPAVYETPAEIEEKAGLAEDAAMQELHAEYERVRYGRLDI